jgi:hypothetical protein
MNSLGKNVGLNHSGFSGDKMSYATSLEPVVMNRRIFAVSSVACLLCTGAPALTQALAQTAREPEAIVKSLYEATMKDPARPGFGVTKADRRLLTTSLRTLWDKAEKKTNPTGKELGAIDFDIVSMSQDPSIASYQLKTEKPDDQHATVVAIFVIGPNHTETGQKVVVNYDFLREGGAWKIDDVRSSIDKKPWTLRGNLAMHLKNR